MEQFKNLLDQKLESTLTNYKNKLAQIRATGAHPSLVSNLVINYYDVPTPLSQLANVKAPDATLLIVVPFDKQIIGDILKAISDSSLGLSAAGEGETIRIVVPPLTQEKRGFFVKQNKELTEETRISVRNTRQDINKKVNSDESLSENEQKLVLETIQKQIDKTNKIINELAKNKENELTTV